MSYDFLHSFFSPEKYKKQILYVERGCSNYLFLDASVFVKFIIHN